MNDEKISVIIPTIQKKIKILYKLIEIFEKDVSVSEIIVINNALKKMFKLPRSKKLKIITPEENLFVNKSWNLGVSLIKNDIFLIINDDILCCRDFCTYILNSRILDNELTGLVGIDNSTITNFDKETTNNMSIPECDNSNLSFSVLENYLQTKDWGSAFFGRKKSYFEIPEDFTIIYGDNYLLYKNKQNRKTNYQISGLLFNHIHSASSADYFLKKIIIKDTINACKYFEEVKKSHPPDYISVLQKQYDEL